MPLKKLCGSANCFMKCINLAACEQKAFNLEYVDTKHEVAHILTKPLPKPILEQHENVICAKDLESQALCEKKDCNCNVNSIFSYL